MRKLISKKICRKPRAIGRYSERWERITTPEDVARFIAPGKREMDPSVCGHNPGAEMINDACLIGMERGSRIRPGLLKPTHYASASNCLNYVGYLGEKFVPDLPGFGPRFMVALPLTPAGMICNRINAIRHELRGSP